MRKHTIILSASLLAAALVAGVGTIAASDAASAPAMQTSEAAGSATHGRVGSAATSAGTTASRTIETGSTSSNGRVGNAGTSSSPSTLVPAADVSGDAAPTAGASTVPVSAGASDASRTIATTSVSCDGILHTVDYDVSVAPLDGFSSQSAAFRSYVYSYSTGSGFWTEWAGIPAPGELLSMHNLPFELGTNAYAVYMQYSWFNGAAWTGAVGAWVQTYTQQDLFGYSDETFCTA
jgi:hypothetical protein